MRKTIGYNKDKNGILEYVKMKPDSEIKGKITVQLVNNDTNEVEQEVYTENVRMKWLDTQIYVDGLLFDTPLYNLKLLYSGYTSSYGREGEVNGLFKELGLFGSEQGLENEKVSSVSGNLIGYCSTSETYAGSDSKKGSFNQAESYIKQDSNGNLVMHNVYEFPSYCANGTTTHIGYLKNALENKKYNNYVMYGTGFECFCGMPSTLIPYYSPTTDSCSWNCYNTGKNTFLFALTTTSNVLQIVELNVVTGECVRNVPLMGEDKKPLNSEISKSCLQISKDGKYLYALVYVLGTTQVTSAGVAKEGWSLLTFDTTSGNIVNRIEYGSLVIGTTSNNFDKYSIGVIDEKGNGNIILFGCSPSISTNYIQEINVNDGTCVKCITPYEYTDSDNTEPRDIYRGTLLINENNEIVYRRSSNYNTDKNHLVWDRKLNLIRRYADMKDRICLNMNIIGNEGLSLGTIGSSTTNYTYWGLFDRRNRYQVNTLTKLPSPIVKTSNFTMKVQYDMIFEMPNILDSFIEKEV